MVRQQLDSFREFVGTALQEIVNENGDIIIKPDTQHIIGEDELIAIKEFRIKFGQIFFSKPTFSEVDGDMTKLFPREARLRNLTYSAPLFINITKIETITNELGAIEREEVSEKIFVGEVPIMLKSSYCLLNTLRREEAAELGECPYDQGGYFIINGSEKVLIAQERMANNHVYVFKKSQPSKYSCVAECRSVSEKSNRTASTVSVQLLSKY